MGCDIHLVIENKYNKKWVGIASSNFGYRPKAKDRNYEFFAELVGVRGESKAGREPLGLPKNCSNLAKLSYNRSKGDYHSMSYMSVEEFVDIWQECNQNITNLVSDYYNLVDDCLSLYEEDFGGKISNGRVVFWFDN